MVQLNSPAKAVVRRTLLSFRLVCVAACAAYGCGGHPAPTSPSATQAAVLALPPASAAPAVLVGAGDIAHCGPSLATAEATAALLDGIDGTVFTAGDNTQDSGTEREYRGCFEPTWGRHRSRMRPSPGNHDYGTPGAGPYFHYFGRAAGAPGAGYYSYDTGGWHVVALNSNIPMHPGSPQETWLRQDLEASQSRCTAAYWHHPLVSSGPNGGTAAVRDLWTVLYDFGAEIIVNGHDHLFERFAPQDPSGRSDPARGIRQFTVGTGGYGLYDVKRPQPNSEVIGRAHGVLKLTLRSDGYDWQFVSVPGSAFSDSGTGACR
jgi:hypothetical protein